MEVAMKGMMRSVAFFGLLCGTALVVEDKADACASYRQDSEGNCTCLYFQDRGYEVCNQAFSACVLAGSGCGGGPGIILP
jgi:hypothetical protein